MSTEASELKKGGWQPSEPMARAPVFVWPLQPLKTLKWFVFDYLLSWLTIFYVVFAILTWVYLTPSLATTRQIEFGWVVFLLARNLLFIVLAAGGWHLHLYIRKAQGLQFKYSGRWPGADSRTFLFRNQVRDNVFWTLVSAVPIWTAYEVLSLWAMSNGFIPYVDFATHPIYCVLLVIAIPPLHSLHFYLIHRLIHWPPLYRTVHYLHHKNVNPGPWSGLAMHPVEHLLFFSGALLHWVIPSNPLHIIFHLQLLAFGAVQGHTGFQKLVIGKAQINHGDYFHYLHHKFFECNYGDLFFPLDEWTGTFHDGSKESEARMRQRLLALRKNGRG